ncbi:MAG: aspartate kinase [Candidatus Eremiobacteraeota bacterium]|nr:aspartate kinase [Candidatus Eremiobacteraeota bacterium]
MSIIIQKYGGSSLATEEMREAVAEKIVHAKRYGSKIVAVLSAIGRYPDPYATDTLIRRIEEHGEPDPREKDLIMATGEIFSCITMKSIIQAMGEEAVVLTGFQAGIVTDGTHGDAKILSVDPSRILGFLERNCIVLVAGFQGISRDKEITTLGRGGSDTTATALGAALGAERVEIYTDVSGVMSADPRIYGGSQIIRELTYQEMGEMANEGAKVLHSRSVDISWQYHVPLWVKGTFSKDTGSFISSRKGAAMEKSLISGLIHRTEIDEFILMLPPLEASGTLRRRLLEELAGKRISLDLINFCYEKFYFVTARTDSAAVEECLRAFGICFSKKTGMAKISCVGMGMKGTPGVMAAIQRALHAAHIRIWRSVDSYITLSCLIDEASLPFALEALHSAFGMVAKREEGIKA